MNFPRLRRSSFAPWAIGFSFLAALAVAPFLESPAPAVRLGGQLATVGLYGLFSLKINIRRLHDLNRTGRWAALQFVPVLGLAFFFYLLLAKGTAGANAYGPDPRPAA
ncbi:DUF805 domain-containing protein [Hymenobacter arizonensis]|uniref:Uncharacterized membrane protein YhaH, DUF805 family n=1 Tax=Hymenobacter arizonensis TaxID=1227077 RepID=A0A1I6BNE1_HYMAR|nr:DUF805 domain-containing protein [Hymenobacter arizonensis]SFQ82443.1 Uncharacterized membrane protein YhaH, DUF805 family [Hymenobacter arizonensis]